MTTVFKDKGWHKIIDRSVTPTTNFYEISIKVQSSSLSYFAGVPTGDPQPTSSDNSVYLYEPKSIETKIFYTQDNDVWINIRSSGESYSLLDTALAHSTIPAPLGCALMSSYDPAHFLLGGGSITPVEAKDVETSDGSNVQTHIDTLTSIKVEASDVVDIIEGSGSAKASKLVLLDQDGLGTGALAINNRGLMLQDETTAEATFVETAGLPVFYNQEMVLNAGMWHADGASTNGNNERGVVFNAPLADVGDYVIFRNIAPAGVENFIRQRFDVVPVFNSGTDTSFIYDTTFTGGNYGGGTFGMVFYKDYSKGELYPWTAYTTNVETPQGLGVSISFGGTVNADCRAITGAGYPLDIKIEIDATKKIMMYYNVRQEVIDAGVVTGVAGFRYLAKTNGTVPNDTIYLPLISLWEYANNKATNDLLYHDVSNVMLYKLLVKSYYLVYDISASDKSAVTVIDSSTVTISSTSRTVTLVSHPTTYNFDGTEWKVIPITHEELTTIKKSKVFTTYPVATKDEVKERANALRSLHQKKLDICTQVVGYITGFEDQDTVVANADLIEVLTLLSVGYLVAGVNKVISLTPSGIITATSKEVVLDMLRETYYKFPTENVMVDF